MDVVEHDAHLFRRARSDERDHRRHRVGSGPDVEGRRDRPDEVVARCVIAAAAEPQVAAERSQLVLVDGIDQRRCLAEPGSRPNDGNPHLEATRQLGLHVTSEHRRQPSVGRRSPERACHRR